MTEAKIEIGLKEIYDKLLDIEKHVLRTNGKVNLNTLKIYISAVILVGVIGWIVKSHFGG